MAISLQTRDPETARRLGVRLNGFALGVRDRIRARDMSFDNVKESFIEEGTGDRVYFDPVMVDEALARAKRRASWNVPYTEERERRMLADMGWHFIAVLRRRAVDVRSGRLFNFGQVDTNWVRQAIREDRVQAEVFRLLGLMGSSAQVRPADRERLDARRLDAPEIAEIDAAIRRQAPSEAGRDWVMGPDREVLTFHLDKERIAPTVANVRRLRGSALCLLADLVEKTSDRYETVPSHIAAVADEILADSDLPNRQARRPVINPELPRPSQPTENIPAAAEPAMEPDALQAADDGPTPAILNEG